MIAHIHIGEPLEEMQQRVIDAWHRAERGEEVCERHFGFENWETFKRVLDAGWTPETADQQDAITLGP